MAKARYEQVNLDSTPYYHVMCRCVRRAFLCGHDKETGQDFSHRKQWIIDRLYFLSSIFAIDIAAFAVMTNHYHLVLHIDKERIHSWSNEVLIEKVILLFKTEGNKLKQSMSLNASNPLLLEALNLWRERLRDISWFMRCMNEIIAKNSNKEDDCKGRFWEGRFKSQALLDEGALLSAMAYVDLNPIRAGLNTTLEDSEFTSIKARIEAYKDSLNHMYPESRSQPIELMNFQGSTLFIPNLPTIDFQLDDYLRLVEETGKIVRADKRGSIPRSLEPILSRLNLNPKGWLSMSQDIESQYAHVVGHEDRIMSFANYISPPKGSSASRKNYYNEAA